MPLVGVLARIERRGMLVDVDRLQALSREFASRMDALMHEIYALAGGEFNIGSPPQLRAVLFDRLGLSKRGVRRGKTGFSTDVDVLTRLRSGASAARQDPRLPRSGEAQVDLRRCAAGGGQPGHRAPAHQPQPDRRRHWAAELERAEPAEHPGARRGGPPHSRGLHRARRLGADRRRLLADRAARARASVGRRRLWSTPSRAARTSTRARRRRCSASCPAPSPPTCVGSRR